MLKKVILGLDSSLPETWTQHDVEDVGEFLQSTFGQAFPKNARIYEKEITKLNDVTPFDEGGIQRLLNSEGPLFVIVYPAGPAAFLVAAIVVAVAAYALLPKPPAIPNSLRNQSATSPNNDLSQRSNRARINGRVPDIFGTVRSTPDLIGPSYSKFENNTEVEFSYMCIGRGKYDISDIRDGDTLCVNIPGTTIQVYEPFTSPNSSDGPSTTIGTPRNVPVIRAERSNSVNGQVLRPPNGEVFTGAGNVRFVYPNIVELAPGSLEDFTKFFVPGDEIAISGAVVTASSPVTETLTARAAIVDARVNYLKNLGAYYYDVGDGGLLFEISDQNTAYGLFSPGDSVVLTQVGTSKKFPSADLSGTYTVDTVSVNTLTDQERRLGIKQYVIVTFVDPSSVNSDWDTIGGGAYDWLGDLGKFTFQIAHDGSDVPYSLDLDGTYDVISVTKDILVLDDPNSVNGDWDDPLGVAANVTPFLSPTITPTEQGRWVGPFILTDTELSQLLCNFVAQNGLYTDDGTDQTALTIDIEVEATPVDDTDTPIGSPETFSIELKGSATLKETVAVSLERLISSFYGRCSVRARRVTEHDDTFTGTVVDEVRWRDLYSIAFIDQNDFGNVTTVQAVTFATASALAVKERKLNMLVTRKLPPRVGTSGTVFNDAAPVATNRADAILVAICRDRYIGNRDISEVDVDGIYAAVQQVEDYFGSALAAEFCYTFDNDNLSFEETVASIAQTIFSIAYRQGSVIKLRPEVAQTVPVLLFNHRNKVPGTEKRQISFGFSEENDGFELSYIDPADDSSRSVFLPEGSVPSSPKKIESIGVRNHLQAYFHAWRGWNKLRYQHTGIEFDALAEAQLLIREDLILVTDGMRQEKQEGEVTEVSGLTLTLSQNVDLATYSSYVIFLQLYDGTVESIGITAGAATNQVVLDDAPSLSLVSADDRFVRTLYTIVGAEEAGLRKFLVAERGAAQGLVSTLRAINYDPRYYNNNTDYINSLITVDGYGPTGGFTPDPNTEWPAIPPPPPSSVTVNIVAGTTTGIIIGFTGSGRSYGPLAGSIDNDTPTELGLGGTDHITMIRDHVGSNIFEFEVIGTYTQDLFTSITINGHTYDSASADTFSAGGSTYWAWNGKANLVDTTGYAVDIVL